MNSNMVNRVRYPILYGKPCEVSDSISIKGKEATDNLEPEASAWKGLDKFGIVTML